MGSGQPMLGVEGATAVLGGTTSVIRSLWTVSPKHRDNGDDEHLSSRRRRRAYWIGARLYSAGLGC